MKNSENIPLFTKVKLKKITFDVQHRIIQLINTIGNKALFKTVDGYNPDTKKVETWRLINLEDIDINNAIVEFIGYKNRRSDNVQI